MDGHGPGGCGQDTCVGRERLGISDEDDDAWVTWGDMQLLCQVNQIGENMG